MLVVSDTACVFVANIVNSSAVQLASNRCNTLSPSVASSVDGVAPAPNISSARIASITKSAAVIFVYSFVVFVDLDPLGTDRIGEHFERGRRLHENVLGRSAGESVLLPARDLAAAGVQ